MGTAGGSKDNIVANVSRWAPPRERARGWRRVEERDPDSHVPGGERKMVAEARDEGVRKQTIKKESQDHSPWWGSP